MTSLPSHLTRTPRPLSNRSGVIIFFDSARSEWVKLRSLRSATWLSCTLLALSILMAFSYASNSNESLSYTGASAHVQAAAVLTATSIGMFIGQFLIAALAGAAISNEYSTGMIKTTLVGNPRRLMALGAKLFVTAGFSFVIGIVAGTASLATGFPILQSRGVTIDVLATGAVGSILWQGFYFACIAVFAVGLGTVLRSTAATLALVIGSLVAPFVLLIVNRDWLTPSIPYFLSIAGQNLAGLDLLRTPALPTWAGLLTMMVWALVPAIIGSILLNRRDA
jgi:ABC-2 type transport system permease protein